MQIISIGEVLWDVFGQKELLGGAPLNFSANSQRLGHSVHLLSAVGDDSRGSRAIEQIKALGLSTEFVQVAAHHSTGAAVVETDLSGNASYVIERPAAFDFVHADDSVFARLKEIRPDWIYFGTLAQTNPPTERILLETVRRCFPARCFYDMNLRPGHWNLPLVQQLSGIATVLKLNEAEAELLFHATFPPREFSLDEFCTYWSSTYEIGVICVTLGSKGCAFFVDGHLSTFEGFPVEVADTVGAGDAFAAGLLYGLDLGWLPQRIASFANGLGAIVASRRGATPAWTVEECYAMIDRIQG